MTYSKKIKKRFSRFHPIARLREKKLFFKKGIQLLPHLFTLGNAFFGFCSLVLMIEGEQIAAAYCIFLGAMMDALDGRVARFMRVESELGVQLDSLCDAITFCLAPAFLAYAWLLRSLGFIGIFICTLFLLAGLLRLARFNLLHDQQTMFFMGLPTTLAGCFITAVLLNAGALLYTQWFLFFVACLVMILAWLMISSIRFPSFKKKLFGFKKNYVVIVSIIMFAIMAVLRFQTLLLLLLSGYFLITLIYHLYEGFKQIE